MDTETLLGRLALGDSAAAELLLTRHQVRLKRMVSIRLDPRLAARVDPSDVVQDTLTEAHRRLSTYAVERPIPFYPWLRSIAWDRLMDIARRHIQAQRRSVSCEVIQLDLSTESRLTLVARLAERGLTPGEHAVRQELRARVQDAVDQLPPKDREIIVLKHLEELSIPEAAAVMGVDEQAVYSRYRRAIQRLHRILDDDD